ncbi:MAG: RnfABCDGE type electron transport complex subunit G [Eubacteriales bacterium]
MAGTNLLTKEKIAEQQALKAEESRRIVLDSADSFEAQDNGEYYAGIKDGQTVGYVFETESKGYGGTVRVMTGISSEGEITGVVVLSHSETPGLGANAEKEDFRNQYKQAAPESGIEIVKYQTPAEGQIEAMTGATITTKAVTQAVNQAVEKFYTVKGGA